MINLARTGRISTLCIDKAHDVYQQGHNFCPEFLDAVSSINKLLHMSIRSIPLVVMSATITQRDIDPLFCILGISPSNAKVFWMPMNRQTIFFDVSVSGNPTVSVHSAVVSDYRYQPNSETIICSNSKMSAEESIVNMGKQALATARVEGEVMAFTGDCGLMQKVYLMKLFCCQTDECKELQLPQLLILAATTAANCGVRSLQCHCVYQIGFLTNFYNMVQGMGRCNRSGSLRPGENWYEIHVSYTLCLLLYLRCMHLPDSAERAIQLEDFFGVLSLVMTPRECYHVALERIFDDPERRVDYVPCGEFCSYCSGDYKQFVGAVKKEPLHWMLMNLCLTSMPLAKDIISVFKAKQNIIFREDFVPKKLSGPYHAMSMQLLALGIIQLNIKAEEKSLIGSKKLNTNTLYLAWGWMTLKELMVQS